MLIRMAGPCAVDALYHAVTFEDLCFAERLVVWTLRMWMHPNPEGADDRREMIETAYHKTGIKEVVHSIDGTLWPLKVGGRDPFCVNCPCTPSLTEDEMRVLHLLACHQAGAGPATLPVLQRLAPAGTVRAISRPIRLWARRYFSAGLELPMRDWRLPELMGPGNSSNPDAVAQVH